MKFLLASDFAARCDGAVLPAADRMPVSVSRAGIVLLVRLVGDFF